jgi:hypothetical protein
MSNLSDISIYAFIFLFLVYLFYRDKNYYLHFFHKKSNQELMTNKIELKEFIESDFKTRDEILNQERKYNPKEIKGIFDSLFELNDSSVTKDRK